MITQEFVNTIIEIKAIQDKCRSYDTLLQSTRLVDDLPMDRLIQIYDRIIDIEADRLKLNSLILKVLHNAELEQEVLSAINMCSTQRKQLDITLHNNLRAQNIKIEELLTVQQKNKIRHFNSLLKLASNRLKFNPSKEQIYKDVKFLRRKFLSLPEEHVGTELVVENYINTLDLLEDNL